MEAIPFSIEKYEKFVCTDKTHIVQTAGKLPVRVICTDIKDNKTPVAGLIDTGEKEVAHGSSATGNCKTGYNADLHSHRLVIVPKPPVSLGWAAVLNTSPKPISTGLYVERQHLIDAVGEENLLCEPYQFFVKP